MKKRVHGRVRDDETLADAQDQERRRKERDRRLRCYRMQLALYSQGLKEESWV